MQDLSKNLSNLSRRLNESLKELEPYTQNAKLNQAELKNLEHKLNLSTKDLAQIKPKTEQDIAESLHHDVKSTLYHSNWLKMKAMKLYIIKLIVF